jgi:hypothetical protein
MRAIKAMRCFFMKGGHVVGVEMLPDLSDEEAIEQSHVLYAATLSGLYDGFELWDRARVVTRHEGQKPPVVGGPVIERFASGDD